MTLAVTERLLLRHLQAGDASDLMELNADPAVLEHVGDGALASLDEAEALLDELLERYRQWGYGRWAVVRRDDAAFLGWCGLRMIEREGVDLGFRFFREHWGQGYATEAARASIQLAFEEYRLPYLLGRAAAANSRSHRVLEKLGFEPWHIRAETGATRVHYSILPAPGLPKPDALRDRICAAGKLHARLLHDADQLDYFMLEGNPNILRHADGELVDFAGAGRAIERHRASARDADAQLRVFAVGSEERHFVGTVATVREGDAVEIGYRLLESCQGRGLGRNIGSLALSLARQQYPGRALVAHCDLRNEASLRVLEGLGGERLADHEQHAHWRWRA